MTPHHCYCIFVLDAIKKWLQDEKLMLEMIEYKELIIRMVMLDLTPALPRLKRLYSNMPRGQKPADPLCLFRSILLMMLCRVTSFDEWVRKVRSSEVLAVLTGFPEKADNWYEESAPTSEKTQSLYDAAECFAILEKLEQLSPSNSDASPDSQPCQELLLSDKMHRVLAGIDPDFPPKNDVLAELVGIEPDLLPDHKSITKLVKLLARTKLLPGVGTYYRMYDRLIDGVPGRYPKGQAPSDLRRQRTLRPPRPIRKQKTKEYKAEQDKKGITKSEELYQQYKEEESKVVDSFETRVQELLLLCCVVPSAQQGLLGDLAALDLSGDGSVLVTGASSVGKPTCDCRQNGIYTCEHLRSYTDATAEIAYDSHRKRFFFGHNLYHITFHGQGFDLPLFPTIGPGDENDFTLSLKSLHKFLMLLELHADSWKVRSFAGDGHHDCYGFYHYLQHKNIYPVIPLREPTKQALVNSEDRQRFSADGVPLCEAGVEMCLQGHDTKKHTLTYICPCKSKLASRLENCPIAPETDPDYRCQPETKWGPAVKVHCKKDPRIWPEIPRNTKKYRKLYNARSSCERTNSTLKCSYKLEQARHRSSEFWLIRATLIDMCHYTDVWTRQTFGVNSPSLSQIIAHLEMISEEANG